MTKFDKSQFFFNGGYVTYGPSYVQAKFVARFKYQRGAAKGFASFIAKNFTVEEYFGRLDAGESPLPIAESKGYLLPHIKRWLKERGLPVNQDGYRQLIDQRVAAYSANA